MMKKNKLSIKNAKMLILGITFKENCPDVRNSKAIDIINSFQAQQAEVIVSDIQADSRALKDDYGVDLVDIELFSQLDVIIITVVHREYKSLTIEELKSMYRDNGNYIIGDLKGIFKKSTLSESGFDVFGF